MVLTTERLVLRSWEEADAESLFEYAKNSDIGPIAGWPPHKSLEESLGVIRNVLNGAECYAICEKGGNKAIGAIELKLNGHTDMTERDDECELGYWLGKPFWGRGYMPEAAAELLRRGFEELGMTTIWCGYYDGNSKSKRVQEKVGFTYHHTCDEVPVPLMNEIRIGHTNYMTKEQWAEKHMKIAVTQVNFYENVDDSLLKFAVIITRTNDKWVFCKHKERDTLEVPGGHRENGETILETAKRELREETGAVEFALEPVCVYSVKEQTRNSEIITKETFGMLFVADIKSFEKELHSEIEKIVITENLPSDWTYPLIQPKLLEEVKRRGKLW